MDKLRKKGIISIVLVCALYITISGIKQSPSLPHISELAKSAIGIVRSIGFYNHLLYTMKIVMIGTLLAFVFGNIIAVICSVNERINDVIMPIVNSTKNIPSIALFPLFIVLMGIGDLPRIFVIIWNSVYPIISSTMFGLNSVEREIVEAAENCGANKTETLLYIKLPMSIMSILNGLKVSLGNGFIAIVVAEMLGATKGLGYMVLWSANTFKYADMYVYILVISTIGLTLNTIVDKIINTTERKVYYG